MNLDRKRHLARTIDICRRSRGAAWTMSFLLCSASVAPLARAQIDPDGNEFQVNDYTTGQQVLPSVIHIGNRKFVIVWSSFGADGSADGIVGRRSNDDGTQLRREFLINTYTTGGQTQPVVGGNNTGRFVVVWTNSQAQDGMGSGIFGQRYNALGTKAGAEFQVNAVGSGFQR
ncbi:MAG TPA: hypothetical protein VFO62_09635, partial [Candidatus Binatia bacterium]|nr:hypothetical protein [Candidatus Binatia bacterium]